MMERGREKAIPISAGVVFILLLASLLYFSPKPFRKVLSYLENASYDIFIRHQYRPLSQGAPIAIIDIDDDSLVNEGRWPWPRKKLGQLVQTLFDMGAKVVAFDMMFPEAEGNLAEEIIRELRKMKGESGSALYSELEAVKGAFNADAAFAQALSAGHSILGFVFKMTGESSGELPPPILTLSEKQSKELFIPDMARYLSNVPELQKAAKGGAFINAGPDADGVIRYSPLLLRQGANVFASLGLEGVLLYLNAQNLQLTVGHYTSGDALEGIKIGRRTIPTDPWGRILVPYRGPPYSIPYVSAADVLNKRAPKERIENKILFIGSSATAMGDLVSTSISPVFAGVEIHAQIAASILDGYLPFRPAWGSGLAVFEVLVLGLISAFLLPFLGIIWAALFIIVLCLLIYGLDHWAWEKHQIVLSALFPIFSLVSLYVLNQVFGYLTEVKRRMQMKSVFGQYVPPECIDSMLKEKGKSFGLHGENKELSVLFADIRGFTTISEGMSAAALKQLLNDYLTPMTEVIFQTNGTIDKYVGDMVMAFWGAPLEDPTHAENAVRAAFRMQNELFKLNALFRSQKRPEIQIGIGINTGMMDVGDMGSKFRRAYTVLGDAVNLGSRLESATKYYHVGILVGEKTYELTKQKIVYKKIDRVKVKGKSQGIDIYEPLCFVGECLVEVLERLQKHNLGIEAYRNRKWDEAEKAFKELYDTDPSHEFYGLYLARIANFRAAPPPDDWDGTSVLESK